MLYGVKRGREWYCGFGKWSANETERAIFLSIAEAEQIVKRYPHSRWVYI